MGKQTVDPVAVESLLGQINTKEPYGSAICGSIVRVWPTVAFEAVALRFRPEAQLGVEVYLTRRPQDEPAYAGQLNCPGSMLRVGEEEDDVFDRLAKNEFGKKIVSRTFVGNFNHTREKRGHFFTPVYWCVLDNDGPGKGMWFEVCALPSDVVEHHRCYVIPMAVRAFSPEYQKLK